MSLIQGLVFLALLLGGFVIGVVDSISGGGSLFMVALLSLLNLGPLEAIVTMRLATLLEELVASVRFIKQDKFSWKQGLILSAVAFGGSLIGATLVTQASPKAIKFVTVIALLSLMPLIPKVEKEQLSLPLNWLNKTYQKLFHIKNQLAQNKLTLIILMILCFALGIYGGFLGAGFQSILLIVLSLITSASFMTVAGNAKLISFVMSLAASSVFLQTQKINLVVLLPLALGSMVGSWKGVGWLKGLKEEYIKWLLYLVVIASVAKMVLD